MHFGATFHSRHRRANSRRKPHHPPARFALPAPGNGNATPATITAALLLSALLHFTLWETLPEQFSIPLVSVDTARQTTRVDLAETKPEEIPEHLLPEELRPPKPRFVEVNPEALTRLPPDTRNTGAGTQRAAQPFPDSNAHSPLPKLDGDEPAATRLTNNIPRELQPAFNQPLPGIPLGVAEVLPPPQPHQAETANYELRITKPAPDTAAPPPSPKEMPPSPADTPETTPSPADAPETQTPNPESQTAKTVPDTAPPPAGNEPSAAPPPPPVAEPRREHKTDADSIRNSSSVIRNSESPKATTSPAAKEHPAATPPPLPPPLPRPQAAKVGTTGVLLKNPTGTNEAGTIALDARFSEFGDYAQRMIEIIQASWWLILERLPIRENPNATVVVEFTLCKDGTLKNVVVLSTTAGKTATYACKDAIESRAPYDPWPEPMIKMLGDEDRARFTFYYR